MPCGTLAWILEQKEEVVKSGSGQAWSLGNSKSNKTNELVPMIIHERA